MECGRSRLLFAEQACLRRVLTQYGLTTQVTQVGELIFSRYVNEKQPQAAALHRGSDTSEFIVVASTAYAIGNVPTTERRASFQVNA